MLFGFEIQYSRIPVAEHSFYPENPITLIFRKEIIMFNLTTPRAILLGFLAVSLAIASIPYGIKLMDANVQTGLQRVQLCGLDGNRKIDCVKLTTQHLRVSPP